MVDLQGLAAMVTDPVCGMAVEQVDNPHLRPRGQAWSLCSAHGRDEFVAQPGYFPPQPEKAAS